MSSSRISNEHFPFRYLDESSHTWPEYFQRKAVEGCSIVPVDVAWGAHESMRGVRDFSSKSRLRLERLFSIAHSNRILLDLNVGFSADANTFPSWTGELSNKSWIPAPFWLPTCDAFSMCEIPSLWDEDFFEGFLQFVQDLSPLLNLYRVPEGPIHQVTVDLSLYRNDIRLSENPEFTEALARRYLEIARFNRRYQTTFKTFENLRSGTAWRVLFDKRTWLTAFDFKTSRGELLKKRADRIAKALGLRNCPPLTIKLAPVQLSNEPSDFRVIVDGMLLEIGESRQGRKLFPFSPVGSVQSEIAQTFRLADYLNQESRREGVCMQFVEESQEKLSFSPVTAVVCGKYLTSYTFRQLQQCLLEGTNLFFPLGIPRYDEEMKSNDDWMPKERATLAGGPDTFFYRKVGPGKVIFPSNQVKPDKSLWQYIRRSCLSFAAFDRKTL